MRKTSSIAFSLAVTGWCICAAASAAPSSDKGPCSDALSRKIPPRQAKAPAGTDFARSLQGLSDDEREEAILEQLLAGNIPEFLRRLRPVRLSGNISGGQVADVTVCVAPDYLAVGSDENYFLVPMRLSTALTVASRFSFALPTTRIVDAIYSQAHMHLRPQPLPAGDTMRTTAYYWEHNELVQQQRTNMTGELGALTAGDKKDLVLTNRLWTHPLRVAIYGWHRQDGNPIQPLSTVHGFRYADYSHGVRLVSDTAYVDGRSKSLLSVLQDPRLASVVSSEGKIHNASALLNVLLEPHSGLSANASSPMRATP